MALKGFKSQPDTITAVAVQKAILDLGVTLRK